MAASIPYGRFIRTSLALYFTVFSSCFSMDFFEDKVDTYIDEETIEVYESTAKVTYYEAVFKHKFPEIKPLVFCDFFNNTTNTLERYNYVELGNSSASATYLYQDIYFADEIYNNVMVCFTYKWFLSGLVSIFPTVEVHRHNEKFSFDPIHVGQHKVVELTTPKTLSYMDYKVSYPSLDRMLEFIEKNIGKDKFDELQVSLITNFYSQHLFHVCHYLKSRGIPLTAAHFPKLVAENLPNLTKKFYDPGYVTYTNREFLDKTSYPCWINKMALDAHGGSIMNDYKLSIFFVDRDAPNPISIPKEIPSLGFIEKIKTDSNKELSFFYDSKVIKKYKLKLANFFPNAKEIPFIPSFSTIHTCDITKVDVGEFSYQADSKNQAIYTTEGVWECVALIMHSPIHNLMMLSHQPWKKNTPHFHISNLLHKKESKNEISYPKVDKIIQTLDKVLPLTYKTSTTVTLISYYLSKNLINLALHLKGKGFSISHISYHDIVIKKNDTIYLDPATVYRENDRNYDRKSGNPLMSRKVAVNQDGEMTENWSYSIINAPKESQKEIMNKID